MVTKNILKASKCQKLSQIVLDLASKIANFPALSVQTLASAITIKRDCEILFSEVEKIKNDLPLRVEIAKKLKFNYVSELYPASQGGYVAWGARNYGDTENAEFYLIETDGVSDFEENSKKYQGVSEIKNGVAFVSDKSEAFYMINTSGEKISKEYSEVTYHSPILFRGKVSTLFEGEPIALDIVHGASDGSAKFSGKYIGLDGQEFSANPDAPFALYKYSEGLVWSEKDGKQVALNRKGEVEFTLPENLDHLYRFDKGVALGFKNKFYATRSQPCLQAFAISKNGEMKEIPGALVDIDSRSDSPKCDWWAGEGFYRATFGEGEYYFNLAGKTIYPREQRSNYHFEFFSNGYATVLVRDKNSSKSENFLIDKEGKRAFHNVYQFSHFRDGFAVVREHDGRCYLLDKDLKQIPFETELSVKTVREIWSGVICLELTNGKHTYADITGKQLMPSFDCYLAGSFDCGIAEINPSREHNGVYFIDKTGRRLFEDFSVSTGGQK
ncbi:MAG: hypothetical protein NTW50_05350 [Candidatus Berkelbacteria bacterium]|nr:hypothetical protein [Candidatus Berkelbacteria bacterium]